MTPPDTPTAAAAASVPSVEESLRPSHCAGCGYSLTGLPPEGVCPECGEGYTSQDVVLSGWACGSSASLLTGNWRAIAGIVVLNAFVLSNFLIQGLLRGWWTPLSILLTLWGGLVAYVAWRRTTTARPGPIEVHLTSHGFRRVDDPDGIARPPYVAWHEIRKADLYVLGPERYRIQFRRGTPWWVPQTFPLDVEVRCTRPQAAALRDRVAAWMGAGEPIHEAA